jgi:hypothetical protein
MAKVETAETSAVAPARKPVRKKASAGARKSGYITIVVDKDHLLDEDVNYNYVARAIVSDVVLERDVRLDSKKRATLTGAEFDHYHMIVQSDGTIVLEPRVLARPVPPRVLAMIDSSVENLQKGRAGKSIDFAEYRELLDEDDE